MDNPYNDYCYECKINCNDGYYDEQKGEWVYFCPLCPFNEARKEKK